MGRLMRVPYRTLRWTLPLAWVVLTLGTTAAHWYAWGVPEAGTGRTGVLDALCKQVSNTAQVVNGPVWVVSWFVLHGRTGASTALVLNGVGFGVWIGALWVLVAARRRVVRRRREPAAHAAQGLSRRAFLTDSALVTGAACTGAAGVYASMVEPWSLRVKRYNVAIAGLPVGLDGLRLVQLSDTHLGPRIPAGFVSEAVELALSLKPDLYVLTGDYVHMGRHYIEPAARLFRPLLEPRAGLIGTVGVLGNHDHYADAGAMSAALADIGVRMLDNRRVFLDATDRELSPIARRGESLCIAGVGDLLEGTVAIGEALHGVPEEMARVMLSHNPDVAEAGDLVAEKPHRVDLMISGHTHGGQVRLPLIGSPAIPSGYGQKYAYGLVRGPACPVVVSAGVGMSMLPVRFGVAPEVVEITLTCA